MTECAGGCDNGWRQVQEPYVLHLAPDPPDDVRAALLAADEGEAMLAHLEAQITTRRAALRESYYPCKVCRPGVFYRWAQGHLDADHDLGACPECIELLGRKAANRGRPESRGPRREAPPPHPADDF